MTGNSFSVHAHEDQTSREFFHHSSAQRINTDVVLVESLRRQYPNLDLIAVPEGALNLIAYASAGFATAIPLEDTKDPVYGAPLTWRYFAPPSRRLDNSSGGFVERVLFGKWIYKWEGTEFLLYVANGRDGGNAYPELTMNYLLTSETGKADNLIKEATLWGQELHNEVWVFDQGWWQKSRDLYDSIQRSKWEDVILDEDMKKAIISDVEGFYDGRETYADLKVPWKRGIIYYGPPGNGKTISIKAMMHALYQRGKDDGKLSVPTLYVKTLANFGGPEYALRSIFGKARQVAPCYLVFEDLDSIVNDGIRSYFLNEVDGLQPNDGILMVGSTNHLDRLDPGISKRPSRFDRKYFFPNPDYEQRVQYAKFWQRKLKDNKDVKFPDSLCPAVAKITDKFSFAYMQEAFVASLLAIARHQGAADADRWSGPHDPLTVSNNLVNMTLDDGDDEDPDLKKLVLWQEIQKQVHILREEIGNETESQKSKTGSLGGTTSVRTTLPEFGRGEDPDWVRAQQNRWREEMEPDLRNPVVPGNFMNWGLGMANNGASGRRYPGAY
ncbi:P-loop containing nucleoside triphosphate hydrolase protein [Dendryphion nanum]|uniref:P-loop containing nucleoside triphosphate hydrolase protein n=1 Tax=Dendryphion nanum TaxID=256645 RepID=A0A9P9DXI5_9PLEO|nr:P-loop containing nucleoside triphosphate hydrolase protein [Dendryphion nanum]